MKDFSPSNSIHRFACLTAVSAFILLIAGGLVTSTGSGLAVPDWPLSYGQFFPKMAGGVFFEHGHRLIAGMVGLLTFALAAWIWLREPRRWVRNVALAAAGAIVLQALLGGITVLYRLPPQVSISHACLGQAVFCLLVALAQATSPGYGRLCAPVSGPRLRNLGAVLAAAVYVQLILGAVLRHTGEGLNWHLVGALGVSSILLWTSYQVFSAPSLPQGLVRPVVLMTGLLFFQLMLGTATFILLLPAGAAHRIWRAVIPTLHVAAGAMILAAAVAWTLRAHQAQAAAIPEPVRMDA